MVKFIRQFVIIQARYIYTVGSTTVLLCRRLAQHVNSYNKSKYTSCKEILDGSNFSIVLIEKVECETKEELLKRERHHIELIECINKRCPIVSVEEAKERNSKNQKEYYNNNKEAILEKKKEYRNNNKEVILEYHKEYRQLNKEAILEQQKEYRQLNKDKIALRDKEYYINNKDSIAQKQKEQQLKRKKEKQAEIDKAIEELHIAVERVPE